MDKQVKLKTGESYWISDDEYDALTLLPSGTTSISWIPLPSTGKTYSSDTIHSFGVPDFLLDPKIVGYSKVLFEFNVIGSDSKIYAQKNNKWFKLNRGKWKTVEILDIEIINKLEENE